MIDLHAHILPGLDDGARDMEDALELAEMALEGGVDTLVATPHSNQEGRYENYNTPLLKAVYRKLQDELRKEKLPLKLLLGMEIFASEDLQEKITGGVLMGLDQTDCYLVEFPFDCNPDWIGTCLEKVLDIGKTPLIAHPERYACVQDYPAMVYDWLRMGCLSQVNKGSLFGRFGRRAYQAAQVLLDYQLVTCVASDAHRPYMRTTYMADIRACLEERYGGNMAYRLLEKNPKAILEGRKIPLHGIRPERKRRFFW